MAEEGFSFPGIPESSACSICSPPLWPVSPPPAPPLLDRSSSRGSDEGVLGDMVDGERGGPCEEEEEEEEEEKMDMLWEDFNEELPRRRGHPEVSPSWSSASTSSRETAEFRGVEARMVSRTNGALVSARRAPPPGVVVLIKVLKKLFLLHHSHSTHGSMKKPCSW